MTTTTYLHLNSLTCPHMHLQPGISRFTPHVSFAILYYLSFIYIYRHQLGGFAAFPCPPFFSTAPCHSVIYPLVSIGSKTGQREQYGFFMIFQLNYRYTLLNIRYEFACTLLNLRFKYRIEPSLGFTGIPYELTVHASKQGSDRSLDLLHLSGI